MSKQRKRKKGMRYCIIAAALLGISFSASAADSVFSTNILSAGNAPAFRLLNARANVKQIHLSGSVPATIRFFDQNTIAAPESGTNVVIPEYISVSSYATNIVNEIIGESGYTNRMTNAGWFTYNVTNAAATNALSPVAAYAIAANVPTVITPSEPILFSRGVTVQANTNISVILYWNSGQ